MIKWYNTCSLMDGKDASVYLIDWIPTWYYIARTCMHRARCLVALKRGRQHPKTARPCQIFRQGDGHLSVLLQSKTVKNK